MLVRHLTILTFSSIFLNQALCCNGEEAGLSSFIPNLTCVRISFRILEQSLSKLQ